MPWLILVMAGILEVVWASLLPATNGLTRPVPTVAFGVALLASMLLLSRAAQAIPLGTAYGVWVGIGAVGTVLVGLIARGDPASPARLGFLALLVVAIAGLKLVGQS